MTNSTQNKTGVCDPITATQPAKRQLKKRPTVEWVVQLGPFTDGQISTPDQFENVSGPYQFLISPRNGELIPLTPQNDEPAPSTIRKYITVESQDNDVPNELPKLGQAYVPLSGDESPILLSSNAASDPVVKTVFIHDDFQTGLIETGNCSDKDPNVPLVPQQDDPTEAPTEMPTEMPTEAPTEMPTEIPTEAPTEVPCDLPTEPTHTDPTCGIEIPSCNENPSDTSHLIDIDTFLNSEANKSDLIKQLFDSKVATDLSTLMPSASDLQSLFSTTEHQSSYSNDQSSTGSNALDASCHLDMSAMAQAAINPPEVA